MAVLSASRGSSRFAAAYRGLVARGKPAKIALAAVMRKLLVTLNAMLRHRTPWREDGARVAASAPPARPAMAVAASGGGRRSRARSAGGAGRRPLTGGSRRSSAGPGRPSRHAENNGC